MDDRDLPDSEHERPTRQFDLSEEQANDIAMHVAQLPGVFDVTRCVGGKHAGETTNAWSVNFGFRLVEGYHVRAEIHTPEQFEGAALNDDVDVAEEVKSNVLAALNPIEEERTS